MEGNEGKIRFEPAKFRENEDRRLVYSPTNVSQTDIVCNLKDKGSASFLITLKLCNFWDLVFIILEVFLYNARNFRNEAIPRKKCFLFLKKKNMRNMKVGEAYKIVKSELKC